MKSVVLKSLLLVPFLALVACVPGEEMREEEAPKVYGEEIDTSACTPRFIVQPRPSCRLEQREVKAYRGKICYFVFPGSQWEANGGEVGKIREAQAFFERYCIYLDFEEIKVSRQTAGNMRQWYAGWKQRLRDRVVPKSHEAGLRQTIMAQNPGKTKAEYDRMVEEKVQEKLRTSTIPKAFHTEYYNAMLANQNSVLRRSRGCKQTLVVFADEYICRNPKPSRTSATQLNFNQVGITWTDLGSTNVLPHELVHLLGKTATDARGGGSWEHKKCTESIMRVTRSQKEWWKPYQFSNELTWENYQEIITNRAGVNLIEEVGP